MKVRHVDWYADEWLAGTSELACVERGVYITICSLIYSRGGPIPDDERWLTRVCGCNHWRTFRTIRKRLIDLGKVKVDGDKLVVERCLKELQKAFMRSSEARQNASKRWSGKAQDEATTASKNKENNAVADAEALRDSNANYQPTNLPTNIVEIAKAISPSNPRLRDKIFEEDFELWWRAVPRKVGKDSAKAAYAKARRKKGASAAELLDGIRRYADAERSKGTAAEFIKHPTAWLNAGRWQDEEGIDNGHARRDVPTREWTEEEVWAACGEGENSMAR